MEEKKNFKSVKTETKAVLTNIKTGKKKIVDEGHNVIVTDFGILVAALLKQHSGYGGATYWAIGEGEGSSWDSLTTEQREAKSVVGLHNLYGEIARSSVDVDFIDDSNLIVSDPTNRIEVRTTFDNSVVGQIREFAIFGGNATMTSGSGIMIDHKVLPVINFNTGSDQFTLDWLIRFTF